MFLDLHKFKPKVFICLSHFTLFQDKSPSPSELMEQIIYLMFKLKQLYNTKIDELNAKKLSISKYVIFLCKYSSYTQEYLIQLQRISLSFTKNLVNYTYRFLGCYKFLLFWLSCFCCFDCSEKYS